MGNAKWKQEMMGGKYIYSLQMGCIIFLQIPSNWRFFLGQSFLLGRYYQDMGSGTVHFYYSPKMWTKKNDTKKEKAIGTEGRSVRSQSIIVYAFKITFWLFLLGKCI